MFLIADGRECFWQWDLNRQIIVEDPTIAEVHFCNKTDNCSLVVEVEQTEVFANGKSFVESVANVPNILLQNDFPIRVYAYCNDGYTKIEETFKVITRTKPSDYIYTETEVKTVQAIEERMAELEESLEGNIDGVVKEYLEEHPIEVDLTGYATEEYVQNAIDSIEIPEQDLSGYALKTDIPTKVSSLENDSEFVVKSYVDEAIKNIDIPESDLSGYATEQWVKNQGYISSIPSEYVTENELNAKNYVQGSALNAYALKSEIPTVPTKVSELTNDKGYLTEHQDISGKADRTHTHVLADIRDYKAPDLTPYALKTDIPTVPSNVSAFNNDAKYATESHVAAKIAEAELAGGDVDLSGYYTKDETYSKSEVNALIPDVSDFISEIPSEYITESELNAKGYLTEHQSLTDYATKKYVDDAIADIDIPEPGEVDTTNFLTKAQNSNQYLWYVTTSNSNTYTQDYVPVERMESDVDKRIDGDLINGNTLVRRDASANIRLPDPIHSYHAVNRGYVDDKVSDITVKFNNYATRQYVDDAIENIEIPEADIDLSDYYTKTEVDDAIAANLTVYRFDTTGLATNSVTAPQEVLDFANDYIAGNLKDFIVVLTDDSNKKQDIVAKIMNATSNYVSLYTIMNSSNYSNSEYILKTTVNINLNNSTWSKSQNYIYVATRDYVDNAIANIEIPEGGGDADLTNYYTKDETYSKTEVDALIPEIPSLDDYAKKSDIPSLDAYATKTYVDEAIADIDVGGGGGSSGDGVNVFVFEAQSTGRATAEEKAMYKYIHDYYIANNKMPNDYMFYYKYRYVTLITGIKYCTATSMRLIATIEFDANYDGAVDIPWIDIAFDSSGNVSRIDAYLSNVVKGGSSGGSGSDWTITYDASDGNLYNAKEVLIGFDVNGVRFFSHAIIDGTLGYNTWVYHGVQTPDGMKEWYYDGSSINAVNYILIAYKT